MAETVSIIIRDEDLQRALRRMGSAHPRETDNVMRKWAGNTTGYMKRKPYPARVSNYKRTGTLRRSWYDRRIRPGTWVIGNNARQKGRFYPVYVVGPKVGAKHNRQAWMHIPFWWRADEVIEQERIPVLTEAISERYVELFDE